MPFAAESEGDLLHLLGIITSARRGGGHGGRFLEVVSLGKGLDCKCGVVDQGSDCEYLWRSLEGRYVLRLLKLKLWTHKDGRE